MDGFRSTKDNTSYDNYMCRIDFIRIRVRADEEKKTNDNNN